MIGFAATFIENFEKLQNHIKVAKTALSTFKQRTNLTSSTSTSLQLSAVNVLMSYSPYYPASVWQPW